MAQYPKFQVFIIQTLIVHFILLYSIFDIYFTSPILHGMQEHEPKISKPAAKRLILFVTDGLRADKCFEKTNEEISAPFLREILRGEGIWRVSHTRVPTESRPGHVAIIAGVYEDVSAVARGWKENPVEFDSVFNRSRRTWAFGSPDIVLMFTKDRFNHNVLSTTYPAEYEDFAAQDLSSLDAWVFNKVDEMLTESVHDTQLYDKLHEDKIIIFLHLLGLDTNGHRHNPSSQQYMNNIKLVDEGIKNITRRIEEFYNDSQTAFVLTSDHGMSEWGTHGSGHPHETLTPFVSWGAGVAKESLDVDVPDLLKKSQHIEQADISPFMSALIGTAYPVNNVGVLHTDLLGYPLAEKAELMLTNAIQIVDQFLISVKQKEKTTFHWLFRPYGPMSPSDATNRIRFIRVMIQDEKYQDAIVSCKELITLALAGITYYHKYDRIYLGGCVVLTFVGWMFYTLGYLISNHGNISFNKRQQQNSYYNGIWWLIRAGIVLMSILQNLPWTHIVYGLLPTLPFEYIFAQRILFDAFFRKTFTSSQLRTYVVYLFIIATGLEVLIHSFFYRELLSLALLLMGILHYKDAKFFGVCLLLMIFPMLPVVGRGANYLYVYTAGAAALLWLCMRDEKSKLSYLQIFLLFCANFDVLFTSYSVSEGQGLPITCLIMSWSILCTTWCLPLFSSADSNERRFSANAAIFTLFLLLSTSYEAWFVLVLILFLNTWIDKETKSSDLSLNMDGLFEEGTRGYICIEDIIRSFIYLLTITVAFFGTGNIASINSFEPASVFCFLTVFSPFSMAALMLLKVILPFILVACSFHVIVTKNQTSYNGAFLIILLMSDFMGLHFFMWVKDEGSWLEIGTSISHYVITLSTTLVLIILSKVSRAFMTYSAFSCYKKNFDHHAD